MVYLLGILQDLLYRTLQLLHLANAEQGVEGAKERIVLVASFPEAVLQFGPAETKQARLKINM